MKRVWPADEEMNAKLRCMDKAHSNQYCISERVLKRLEDDLNEFTKHKSNVICSQGEKDIIHCINSRKSIYPCHTEIAHFVKCVNQAVKDAYNKKKVLRRDLS